MMEVQEVNQTQVSHMVQVWAEGPEVPEVPEAARPERAEALSPGHRPGCLWTQTCRPVRAKAFNTKQLTKLLPLQGALLIAIIPRALPWAKSFCPFRACCFYELLPFTFALPFGQRFSIPLRAGDRWLRACWVVTYMDHPFC